jgi:hypothetical protein
MLLLMYSQTGLSVVAAGWLATFNDAGYVCAARLAATGGLLQKFCSTASVCCSRS